MPVQLKSDAIATLKKEQQKCAALAELTSSISKATTRKAFDVAATEAKEILCSEITAARISRQSGGFLHTDGISYPINQEAQIAYMGQINAAQLGLPIQCFAHSTDNRQVEMTLEEMMALAAGVMAACETINKEAWKAKEEIRAAETLEAAWSIYAAYFGLTDTE